MQEIDRPIFIIGLARSGTTILDNLFSRHKDIAFFENFSNLFYDSPWKFRFIPTIIRFQQLIKGKNFRPKSFEGRVWRRYFSEIEYLDESDVTDEIQNYYFSAIKYALKAFKAKRFVNKNPAHCLRLKWLNKMFPDAYYILIWRDAKSQICSSYRKMLEHWDKELVIEYEHGYKGFVTVKEKFGKNVSKLQTCINVHNYYKKILSQDLPLLKNRVIELTYEDLIKNPREELKKLYDFTDLYWYKELEKEIPSHLQLSNNEKWKTLGPQDQELLIKTFGG